MALALAMGIATSMVAALIPARNAARVDPVQALQKGKYQVLSAGENRVRRAVARGLRAGLGGLPAWSRAASRVFYAGFLLAMVAALLLTPALALWLTRALRPAAPVAAAGRGRARRRQPDPGAAADVGHRVGADAVARADHRRSAGVAGASYESIIGLDRTRRSTPTCSSPPRRRSPAASFLFPAHLGPTLRQIDGVAEVQSVRTPRIVFRGTPVMLVAVDVEKWAARAGRRPVEGDADEMYRETADGRA